MSDRRKVDPARHLVAPYARVSSARLVAPHTSAGSFLSVRAGTTLRTRHSTCVGMRIREGA
eukprot:3308815-Rhodomonas_salina.2